MDEQDDRDVISLHEARHHVANIFQLITTLARLRAQRGDDPEARRQVEWVHDAIGALGVLQHRMMSPGGEDFAAFLEDMAPHWRRRSARRRVSIEFDTEPLALTEQTASALAVIVQELVANALNHAFPEGRAGAVRVAFRRLDPARAVLSVSDDGVGYAAGGAPDPRRLGLWLIGGLAEQVGGELSIATSNGVVARLVFPTG
jgi:two-component sensor histidine kinase